MKQPLRILLLDNDVSAAGHITPELSRAQFAWEIHHIRTQREFQTALKQSNPDVILSDHTLDDLDGLSALEYCRRAKPNVPFIFVSARPGEALAVESLKHGASDYLIKGDLRRLPAAIARALEEKRLRLEREGTTQKLQNSESIFKSLAEQAPVGIMLVDISGKAYFCNEHWGQIIGRTAAESITMDWSLLFHEDDRERTLAIIQQLMADKLPVDTSFRIVRPSGEIRWVDNRVIWQHKESGEYFGFISLIIDVTEQKLSEQKLARMHRMQEVLSNINSTIVRVSDRKKLCRDFCRIAIDDGKFSLAWIALIDPGSGEIKYGDAMGHDKQLLAAARKRHGAKLSSISTAASSTYMSRRPVLIDDISAENFGSDIAARLTQARIRSVIHMPLTLGDRIFGIFALSADTVDFFNAEEMQFLKELSEDISFALDHLEKEERLNYLAYYDSLTQLPNRTLFLDHLTQYVSNARNEGHQVAMVIFGIDKFRHINESFGEKVGDELLQVVAKRLQIIATSATSLGRIGGDTFGAIIPHCPDVALLMSLFDKQLAEWAGHLFLIGSEEISMSFRAGVALFPTEGDNAESLLQNANAALKLAKHSGQRLLFYSRAINERVGERIKLESRLHQAVEQQQFVLYYQPKINLKTGRIGSVEALMRWKDPERGLIPPLDFIPLLEETGMIYDVGMWALKRAFDDHREMRQRFSHAPYIAVNVSALQLQRTSFYADIMQVIGNTADGHHGVDIEITESLIMHDIEENIAKLKAVRDQNVHIAVDDFGTGYSSLAYIAKLPIDVLKIDRSFIIRMTESEEDRAIVSAIITLAHSLDLQVVAEGVETEEQAQILRLLRCDEAQGYLFCKPLPFDDLIARLGMVDGIVRLDSGMAPALASKPKRVQRIKRFA